MINICKKYLPDFLNVLEDSADYEVKGVLHSEMLLFCSLLRELKCHTVIESGRGRGQSTEILSKWIPEDGIFISVDKHPDGDEDEIFARKRVKDLNVTCLSGDSKIILPQLLKKHTGDNVAILIDGPKGKMALKMAENLFSKFQQIKLIAIHDMHYDANVALRHKAERNFPDKVFFSDSAQFVREFKELDAPCWEVNKRLHDEVTGLRKDSRTGWSGPYTQKKEAMSSYGPTLMCLMR